MSVEKVAGRRCGGAGRRSRWVRRGVVVVATAVSGMLPASALAAAPAVPAAAAAAAALPAGCGQTGATVSCTYGFTGGEQSFTVPSGVSAVQVSAIGAAGAPSYGGAQGGRASQVTGTLTVTAGQVLFVEVAVCLSMTRAAIPWRRAWAGSTAAGPAASAAVAAAPPTCAPSPGSQPNSLASRLLAAGAGGGGGNLGGGGGGGLYGGGGGGAIVFSGGSNTAGGGGGGGSDLVPTGGTLSLTTAAASVTISYSVPASSIRDADCDGHRRESDRYGHFHFGQCDAV